MPSRPRLRTSARPSSLSRTARVSLLSAAAAIVLPFAIAPAAAEPSLAAAQTAAPTSSDGVDTPELRQLRERAGEAQAQLMAATAAYAEAERRLAAARAEATEARARAEAATAEAARVRTIVQDYAAAAYKGGVGNEFVVVLDVVSSGSAQALSGAGYVDHVRKGQNVALDDLVALERLAETASREADEALGRAANEQRELQARAAEVQRLAQAASEDLGLHLEAVDAALAAAQREQAARGAGALARWQAYLDRLAAARVVPPPAGALANPAALPPGMRPVSSPSGAPTPGVAEVDDVAGLPLLVLPTETVQAVTTALSQVGKPYEKGATGPASFDCGGLVSSLYPGLPAGPGDQFSVTPPIDRADAQPGDLIFLGDDRLGLHSVGVYLGEDEMLTAARPTGSVQVAPVPARVHSAGRATLGQRAPAPAPRGGGLVGIECGGFDMPSGGPGGWGGFPNGLIPPSALCPVQSAPGHLLRCDAAAAFDVMAAQYAADLGKPICVTDSYRTYAGQIDVYARKPGLAAVPGTSNHGWALAVDFCGGVQSFGTVEHGWMRANAGSFGWVHPRWAQAGGSRPEAWHWEFGGS